MLSNGDGVDLEEVGGDLIRLAIGALDAGRALLELILDALQLVLLKTKQSLLDHSSVLLKLHAKSLGVKGAFKLLDSPGLLETLLDSERLLSSDRVDGKVISGSVRATDTLDPAIRGLDLKVPTVLLKVSTGTDWLDIKNWAYSGVMGHFVSHVLPASQPSRVYTDLGQEQLSSTEEVTKSLVVDDTLYNHQISCHHGKKVEEVLTSATASPTVFFTISVLPSL